MHRGRKHALLLLHSTMYEKVWNNNHVFRQTDMQQSQQMLQKRQQVAPVEGLVVLNQKPKAISNTKINCNCFVKQTFLVGLIRLWHRQSFVGLIVTIEAHWVRGNCTTKWEWICMNESCLFQKLVSLCRKAWSDLHCYGWWDFDRALARCGVHRLCFAMFGQGFIRFHHGTHIFLSTMSLW